MPAACVENVNKVVMESPTRAGADAGSIQKLIHDMMTMNTVGM